MINLWRFVFKHEINLPCRWGLEYADCILRWDVRNSQEVGV